MSECFLVQDDKYETKPELQAERWHLYHFTERKHITAQMMAEDQVKTQAITSLIL